MINEDKKVFYEISNMISEHMKTFPESPYRLLGCIQAMANHQCKEQKGVSILQYIIHHKSDSICVEGQTVEECIDQTHKELSLRGWNKDDCWSERKRGE